MVKGTSTPAPPWKDGDACSRCSTTFTFLKRKHHCRNCGGVFCDDCSSKKRSLPHYGISEEVRVCDTCHQQPSQQTSSKASAPAKPVSKTVTPKPVATKSTSSKVALSTLLKTSKFKDALQRFRADPSQAGPALRQVAALTDPKPLLWLLEQKADPNAMSEEHKWTALIHASKAGQVQHIKPLLEHKANINHSTKVGWTSLFYAVSEQHEEAAMLLIQQGANVNHANRRGTCLHIAAEKGSLKTISALLDANANIEAVAKGTNKTPLATAASYGRKDAVSLLLERNADVNHANPTNGVCPLTYAFWGHSKECADLLQAAGGVRTLRAEQAWDKLEQDEVVPASFVTPSYLRGQWLCSLTQKLAFPRLIIDMSLRLVGDEAEIKWQEEEEEPLPASTAVPSAPVDIPQETNQAEEEEVEDGEAAEADAEADAGEESPGGDPGNGEDPDDPGGEEDAMPGAPGGPSMHPATLHEASAPPAPAPSAVVPGRETKDADADGDRVRGPAIQVTGTFRCANTIEHGTVTGQVRGDVMRLDFVFKERIVGREDLKGLICTLYQSKKLQRPALKPGKFGIRPNYLNGSKQTKSDAATLERAISVYKGSMPLRTALELTAERLGRPSKDVEPFIEKIEAAWFTDVRSLESCSEEVWKSFGLPSRLASELDKVLDPEEWYTAPSTECCACGRMIMTGPRYIDSRKHLSFEERLVSCGQCYSTGAVVRTHFEVFRPLSDMGALMLDVIARATSANLVAWIQGRLKAQGNKGVVRLLDDLLRTKALMLMGWVYVEGGFPQAQLDEVVTAGLLDVIREEREVYQRRVEEEEEVKETDATAKTKQAAAKGKPAAKTAPHKKPSDDRDRLQNKIKKSVQEHARAYVKHEAKHVAKEAVDSVLPGMKHVGKIILRQLGPPGKLIAQLI